jgi:CBS domain-containing protein
MLVRDLMQREVVTCHETDSLCVAAERMWEGRCGSLPVVNDEGEVVAMITDRDVCMAVCREAFSPAITSVQRVASPNVVTIHLSEHADAAEEIMRRHRVRRLPVVDSARRLVGIVSIHDLAKQAHWAGTRGDRLNPESVVTTEIAIGRHAPKGDS